MEGSLNGLVTMIWILLVFGVLAMYFAIFFALKKMNFFGSPPPTSSEPDDAMMKTELVAPKGYLPPLGDIEERPQAIEELGVDGTKKAIDANVPVKDDKAAATAPVAPAAIVTTTTSIFGDDAIAEYCFNYVRFSSFYSVVVDDDNIKISRIWSGLGKQLEVAFTPKPKRFATHVRIQTKIAPLSMVSHTESYAVTESTSPSLFVKCSNCWGNFVRFVAHNVIFLATLSMLVAAVVCFYVPGTFDPTFNRNDTYPHMSYSLTVILFVFTVMACILHLMSIRPLMQKNIILAGVSGAAFVLLLVVLAMAITLMDVAYSNGAHSSSNGGRGGRSSAAIQWQNAVDQWTCNCNNGTSMHPSLAPSAKPTTIRPTISPSRYPTMQPSSEPSESPTYSFFPTEVPIAVPSELPTEEPSEAPFSTNTPTSTRTPTSTLSPTNTRAPSNPTREPTESPTDHQWDSDYSFECNFEQFAASNYNTCDMNCGVCGQTYYAPFVSFSTFALCYLLLMFFLTFYLVFEGHEFWAGYEVLEYDQSTSHMLVTIHGSVSFGFPMYARMSFEDHLKLEKYLKIVAKREKDEKAGDYMKHMASVSSGVWYRKIVYGELSI